MVSFKKGDTVIVDTSGWSEQTRQKAKVLRHGTKSIGIIWETGELATKEANVACDHFHVVEVVGL